MPVGGGFLPTGQLLQAWSAVTRRSFIPAAQVLPYPATPTLALLLAARDYGTGGISSITQTVQYGRANVAGWMGPNAAFPIPQALVPLTNAEFNYKWLSVPIIITEPELLAQQDQAVFSIFEGRTVDAMNVAMDVLSNYLWYNIPDAAGAPSLTFWPGAFNDSMGITGFAELIDDGTAVATYGGISRTDPRFVGNTWQSVIRDAGSNTPTRASVYNDILAVAKRFGEKPTFGVAPYEVWANIVANFIQNEQFVLYPNNPPGEHYDTAVDAIRVAGVNLIADVYAPFGYGASSNLGNLLLINTNYLHLIVHSAVDWAFTDFDSLQSVGVLAYVGVILLMLEVVNTRPRMHALVKNYVGVTNL